MRLPPNHQWIQTNRSDIFGELQGSLIGFLQNYFEGSLQGSFNINLTKNLGKLRSTRLITNTSGLDGTPVGFKYYAGSGGTNGIYAIAGSKVYLASPSNLSPATAFVADTQTATPTNVSSVCSDIQIFNGFVYVTTVEGGTAKLWKLNTTWAANGTTIGSASFSHMLCPFPLLGRMYITDGSNLIRSVDQNDTIATSGANTIAPFAVNNLSAICIQASWNRLWICTLASSGNGYIFEWDGAATQFTRSYRLSAAGALACVVKDDIPYVIDSNGRLLMYVQNSFKEIARLPFGDMIPANNRSTQNNRFIHPNGMSVVNGKINIQINNLLGDSAGSINEFCPSGIWEYDDVYGLYHKYSHSYTPIGTTTVTDYGQNRISVAGAIAEMKITDGSAGANGSLLAGATIFTNGASTTSSIFYDDILESVSGSNQTTQRACYIVTTKIYSSNILDNWQKIVPYYKKFIDAGDKIVIKYRTSDVSPTDASITWVTTTSFTSISDLSGYANGDEVEITQGTGSGLCAHITDIHYISSTTYSVTIDETATGVTTGTAKARFQKWKKIKSTVTDQTSQGKVLTHDLGAARWIQYKIFMILKGNDEFDGADIVNTPNQLI